MPRYRHVIEVPGHDLSGHLACTLCGGGGAYHRQPNVPRNDPSMCTRGLQPDGALSPRVLPPRASTT